MKDLILSIGFALNNPAPEGDGGNSEQCLLDLLEEALVVLEARVWQPMDTVPMDGTPFLALLEPTDWSERVHVASFLPNVKRVGGCFAFDMPKVIGWMACPEVPE
jgi:hypothetical protein